MSENISPINWRILVETCGDELPVRYKAEFTEFCEKFHNGDTKTILITLTQIWQTHKGGDMDQEDRQHESRRGELPIEPRMGQVLIY